MNSSDYDSIRNVLRSMPSDHDAAGEHRPTVGEIFAPEQHANALDPATPVVVGARGAGKSFWAGVLEQPDTRSVAAKVYPQLGLERLIVQPGYTGFAATGVVSAKTIAARVPEDKEELAVEFWLAVIVRSAHSALSPDRDPPTIRQFMEQYSDPEDLEAELKRVDRELTDRDKTLLVTFDALDTLSRDWRRSSLLIDALFEAVWSLRARKAVRAKVFIRPEQLNDDKLRFIELPKLKSGRVELEWSQLDLYGLLFWRLKTQSEAAGVRGFSKLLKDCGFADPKDAMPTRRSWFLASDRDAQKIVVDRMAGRYMGRSHKKGGTYDWPYKHLGDANGKVTPRSFVKLFVEAAAYDQAPSDQVISAEGIRHGLREASKVRVDQLGIEYPWVKRALAPLAGLMVPCTRDAIFERWDETDTARLITKAASDPENGFLPPFPPRARGERNELLATAMERIGLLADRADGRVDIPDLFRVAALMLKKGSTPPRRR